MFLSLLNTWFIKYGKAYNCRVAQVVLKSTRISIMGPPSEKAMPDGSFGTKSTYLIQKFNQVMCGMTSKGNEKTTPGPGNDQVADAKFVLGEALPLSDSTTFSHCLESLLVDSPSLSLSPKNGPLSEDFSYSSRAQNTNMCTPRMAKYSSISSPGVVVRITTSDPNDRLQEEDDCADGMTLYGFITGKAVYYSFTR